MQYGHCPVSAFERQSGQNMYTYLKSSSVVGCGCSMSFRSTPLRNNTPPLVADKNDNRFIPAMWFALQTIVVSALEALMADDQWKVEHRRTNANMSSDNVCFATYKMRFLSGTQGSKGLKNESKVRCFFTWPLSHLDAITSISSRISPGTADKPQESQHNACASKCQCSLFFIDLRRFIEPIFAESSALQYCSTKPRQ